jgi:pimeloyl-ACP methyl ester carboxylesterase
VSDTGKPVVVERRGRGPEVLLVHGGARPGATWRGLEVLAQRFTVATMYRRGYPPSPAPRSGHPDFEEDARDIATLLDARPHVVAHSYGGVGAMLAAGVAPQRLRSLTLIEPAVHLLPEDPEAERIKTMGETVLARGPDADLETLRTFLRAAGSPVPDTGPLPRDALAAARRVRGTRSPYEAELPLATLRASSLPTLVVSGAHHGAFERNMDALAAELSADRIVAPGAGHFVPAAPGFADRLMAFLLRHP